MVALLALVGAGLSEGGKFICELLKFTIEGLVPSLCHTLN